MLSGEEPARRGVVGRGGPGQDPDGGREPVQPAGALGSARLVVRLAGARGAATIAQT